MSHICPNKLTGNIALSYLRSFVISNGFKLNVKGSISQKTGIAPKETIISTAEIQLKGDVMTSSPF